MNSNALFRELFENMTSGCAIYEVLNDGIYGKDYIIKDFNLTSQRIEGMSHKDVVGKSLFDIRPTIDEFGLVEIFKNVWKTGIPETFPSTQYIDEKYSSWYENYVFKLPTGEIVAMYNDVTESHLLKEELRLKNNTLQSYIKNAPFGIFLIDDKRNILDVNKEACEITGYLSEELINMDVLNILLPQEVAIANKRFIRLKKIGILYRVLNCLTKNKKIKQLEVTTIKIDDSNFLAFAKDITEAYRTQKEIKATAHEYKALFNNAGLGIGYYKPDGEIIWYNQIAAENMGGKPEDYSGKNFHDLFPQEAADIYLQRLQESISSERRVIFEDKIKLNGREIHFSSTYNNIYNEEKELLGVEIISQDISEIRLAEKKLIDIQERYKNVFDMAAVGIYNTAADGEILNANKSCCDMLGYTLKELQQTTFLEITHPDDVAESNKLFKQLINENKPVHVKKRCIRKNGTEVNVALTASMVRDDNNIPLYSVTIIQEIDKEIKLQKENKRMLAHLNNQQKLESIGILAGGIAHEINNPINGVINYSQLIIDDIKAFRDNSYYATEIIHEAKRISEIVKNLLQFSRQETENPSYTDINLVLNHTVSLVKALIKKDQIEISLDLCENLPKIKCREQQIQQVILNLITNARDSLNSKYTEYDENKKIDIKCTMLKEDTLKWIRVSVMDTGLGISKEIRNKIFDPFFTTKSRNKGTGLGLSISYGIIAEHEGRITLETEEGEYSKFNIDLPMNNNETGVN